MPLMTPNLIALSVNKAVNDSVINKRSKSLAHNAIRPLPPRNGDDKSPPSSPEMGPVHPRNVKFVSKSQNNSRRNSVTSTKAVPRSFSSSSSMNDGTDSFDQQDALRKRLAQQRRSGFTGNPQRAADQQKAAGPRRRRGNYLESVEVVKVEEKAMSGGIEVVTGNEFKIRCSEWQLFWIVGRGWGSFDAESSNINGAKLHVLRPGEQLLTVGGSKHRISRIEVVGRKQPTPCFSITVSKNDCFFANDLLVKNALSL